MSNRPAAPIQLLPRLRGRARRLLSPDHRHDLAHGLHIQAPRDAHNQPLPVRAIADGTVIFKRAPKPANNTATDAQNYTPAWTDNGIVIVRHTTDIGATGNTPTTVTYYSVYMHLSSIDAAVEEKKPIWRKDVIGKAGTWMEHAAMHSREGRCSGP